MKDKELITYHSRMDRPVPGEGLLTDPNNPYPYTSELWSPFWYWTDIPIPLCDLILSKNG